MGRKNKGKKSKNDVNTYDDDNFLSSQFDLPFGVPARLLYHTDFHPLQNNLTDVPDPGEYRKLFLQNPFSFSCENSPTLWHSTFTTKVRELLNEPEPCDEGSGDKDPIALGRRAAQRAVLAEYVEAGINTILGYAFSRSFVLDPLRDSTDTFLTNFRNAVEMEATLEANGEPVPPGPDPNTALLANIVLRHDEQLLAVQTELQRTRTELQKVASHKDPELEKLKIGTN